jgi:hypothetical protein
MSGTGDSRPASRGIVDLSSLDMKNAMRIPFVSCFGCKEGQRCWCLCVYPFLVPYLLFCSSPQLICLQSGIEDQYQNLWNTLAQLSTSLYYNQMWLIKRCDVWTAPITHQALLICSRPQLNCLQSGIQDQDQNAMKFPFVSCFGCKEGQGCWCLCVYPFLLPYLLICSSAQVICLQSGIQDQYQKFRICETPWPKFLQVYYSRMWVIQMMWSLKCSNHRPGLMSTRHETASTGKIAKHCAVPASIATMVQVSSLLFELFFFCQQQYQNLWNS